MLTVEVVKVERANKVGSLYLVNGIEDRRIGFINKAECGEMVEGIHAHYFLGVYS